MSCMWALAQPTRDAESGSGLRCRLAQGQLHDSGDGLHELRMNVQDRVACVQQLTTRRGHAASHWVHMQCVSGCHAREVTDQGRLAWCP